MTPRLEMGAITDEFSPDLAPALDAMRAIGMTAAELRMLGGANVMDLTDEQLRVAAELVAQRGMRVLGISSPLLKCVLPEGGEVDQRFQQDVFGSNRTLEDQQQLAERAIKVCEITGAQMVRVFSFWRAVETARCEEAICEWLTKLASLFGAHGIVCGLENEHACNVGLASEAKRILDLVPHPNLKLVWDPANMLVGGESPYPGGYEILPKHRIAHVHAKDCRMEGHTPHWGPLGTCSVDWKGQVQALLRDGYRGAVSLETHWGGPKGNKMEASIICGWNLRSLLAA